MQTENGLSFLSRVSSKPVYDLGKELFSSPLNPPEIVEISGNAGSGKSLLCLDFLASALLPKVIFNIELGGLDTGVIFIDCDNHFSILHFADLLERKVKKKCREIRKTWRTLGKEKAEEELMTISKKDFNTKIEILIKNSLKNLYYFNCSNNNQFTITLLFLEQCLVGKSNVSFVFVDSISAFYWYDRIYKVDSWYKMELHLNNVFRKFINIIKKNYLICICTKQSLFKSQKEKDNSTNLSETVNKFEQNAYAYLGKVWNNSITIKITLNLETTLLSSEVNEEKYDTTCTIETIQKDVLKTTKWSFHDDGLRQYEVTFESPKFSTA